MTIPDPEPTPCTATTAARKPCRAKAMPATSPAVCAMHCGIVGPKLTLTPEIVEHVTQLLRAGNYVETAVVAAGVNRNTFFHWCEKGSTDDGIPEHQVYRDLVSAVAKARAEGEAILVTRIAAAAVTDWKAAAWVLERSKSDRWARVTRPVEDAGVPIAEVVTVAPDQFSELDAGDATTLRLAA